MSSERQVYALYSVESSSRILLPKVFGQCGEGGWFESNQKTTKKRGILIVLHSCSLRRGLEAKLRPSLYPSEHLTEDVTNENVVI